MNAMSTRSPSEASALTAASSLGTGALSPVSADSSISRVAARTRRPSAGTRSPASMLMTSPGTMSCIATIAIAPFRRTLAWTTIIFWSAATLASALPSWLRPSMALKTVSRTSTTPVANCPGRNMLTMPAPSSTICIGSEYCARNAFQRGTLAASANLFGPALARRVSTSASVRPASCVTPSASNTSAGAIACQAGVSSAGAPAGAPVVGAAMLVIPSPLLGCAVSLQENADPHHRQAEGGEDQQERPHELQPGAVADPRDREPAHHDG